jgi:hypothetical protein
MPLCKYCGAKMWVSENDMFNSTHIALKQRIWHCERCHRDIEENYSINVYNEKEEKFI